MLTTMNFLEFLEEFKFNSHSPGSPVDSEELRHINQALQYILASYRYDGESLLKILNIFNYNVNVSATRFVKLLIGSSLCGNNGTLNVMDEVFAEIAHTLKSKNKTSFYFESICDNLVDHAVKRMMDLDAINGSYGEKNVIVNILKMGFMGGIVDNSNFNNYTKNDASDLGAFTVNVEIPIKIDVSQFLLFSNFKYLPAFCGTWSIKLYPSTRNMILCPVDPTVMMTSVQFNKFRAFDLSQYTHNFVQKGDTIKCITGLDENAPVQPTFTDVTIEIGSAKMDEVLLHQTQFELMYDIYDGLKSRYMARPLTIPVNKLDYGRFAGAMKNSGVSSTYTAAIQNCESMFILPFTDDDHHTVCFNPKFTDLYLNISGYGNFPQQPFDTFGDNDKHTRFMNMTLDAFNINNSPLMGPNEDLLNSLENRTIHTFVYNGAQTEIDNNRNVDGSNFLIGIPFSNDIDFEGGLTSNGNINFKLTAGSSVIETLANQLNGGTSSLGATVMFVKDAALMIKVVPYATEPECRLIEERIV